MQYAWITRTGWPGWLSTLILACVPVLGWTVYCVWFAWRLFMGHPDSMTGRAMQAHLNGRTYGSAPRTRAPRARKPFWPQRVQMDGRSRRVHTDSTGAQWVEDGRGWVKVAATSGELLSDETREAYRAAFTRSPWGDS